MICTCNGIFVMAFINKGVTFCNFLFAFLHSKPLPKGSTLKGKNLLPAGANSFLAGSKFFPFRVDPFLDGDKNNFYRVASLKLYQCINPLQHNSQFSLSQAQRDQYFGLR